MAEQTKAQIIGFASKELGNPLPASYATYRTMRKQPTVALARALSAAPIMAADWTFEGEDEEKRKFIEQMFEPLRHRILESAMFGGIDFGWQGYEKVFDVVDGRQQLVKLKPLLQDITIILIDEKTGAFAGFKQDQFELPLENCLLISFRVEGTMWYGNSLLENARAQYNDWDENNETAKVYDQKVAGAHIVVKYPQEMIITKPDGTDITGYEAAQQIVTDLENNGSIAVPNTLDSETDIGWCIDILEDQGKRTTDFVSRAKYLDSCIVRALLLPERAILEGEFGTKAEAKTHAEIAVTHMELIHQSITEIINWHVVDQVLEMNFGEEAKGSVKIIPAPLVDDRRKLIESLYVKVLQNPQAAIAEYSSWDLPKLRDLFGIPANLSEHTEIVDEGMDGDERKSLEDTEDGEASVSDSSEDFDDVA